MPNKDFYMILGVSRTESPDGIRAAFRDLARRYHPDRAGPRGTRFFQDVVQAYQVLSDQERRSSYDRGLRDAGGGGRIPVTPLITRPAPRPASRSGAEPLIPEPLVPAPISLMRDFEATRPSREEVYRRLRRNFVRSASSRALPLDALQLQVRIGTGQAARGGILTLGVPVFYPCPRCHGEGHVLGYSCPTCGEAGMVEQEEPVRVRIPPMVRHGTEFQLPLRGLGIHNLYLQIRILVGD
jgi:hypothetical protein